MFHSKSIEKTESSLIRINFKNHYRTSIEAIEAIEFFTKCLHFCCIQEDLVNSILIFIY